MRNLPGHEAPPSVTLLRIPAHLCRRLVSDTRGQVLLFGIVAVCLLLVFLLAIPNGTQVTSQKLRVQTAADAGAYCGAVWVARALNLNANLNVGIRSIYTWMTVLTAGSALAQALYRDSLDASVRELGREIGRALFDDPDPVHITVSTYPAAIQQLATTAQWLSDLQDDIAASFPMVARTAGSFEVCRNASGGNPAATNPGGRVLIQTDDTVPMLVASACGDSLLLGSLTQLAGRLESLPTNDSNIGPAAGTIQISLSDLEVKAYYGTPSRWLTLVQGLCGMRRLTQWYHIAPEIPTQSNYLQTAWRYFNVHNDAQLNAAAGKSWLGSLTLWFRTDLEVLPGWRAYGKKSYSVPNPGDTLWVHQRHYQFGGEPGWRGVIGDTATEAYPLVRDSGYEIVRSGLFYTDFYSGAESTRGNQGPRIRLRRLNPNREFCALAYAWHVGSATTPRGPGPRVGGALLSRNRVASPSPMLAVTRSVPYLALDSPTDEDYFFSPNWEARLTPVDSAGVQRICHDPTYDSLGLGVLDLEGLRRYVLLP